MSDLCQSMEEITQHQPDVPSDVDDTEPGALRTTCVAVLDKLPREDLYPPAPSSSDSASAAPLPDANMNNATQNLIDLCGSKKSRTTSRTKNSTSKEGSERKNKQSTTARKTKRVATLPDVYEWVDLSAHESLPTPMPTLFTDPISRTSTSAIPDIPGWITSTGTLPGICDITVRFNPYCLSGGYVRHIIEDSKYTLLSDHRGPTRRARPTWTNLYCTECLPLQ